MTGRIKRRAPGRRYIDRGGRGGRVHDERAYGGEGRRDGEGEKEREQRDVEQKAIKQACFDSKMAMKVEEGWTRDRRRQRAGLELELQFGAESVVRFGHKD